MKKKLQIKSMLLLTLSFTCFINIQDAFSQTAVTPPDLTTKNWHIQNVSTGERMIAIKCDGIGNDVKLVASTEVGECAQYQFIEESPNVFYMINRQTTAGHIPKGGCSSADVDQKIRQVSGGNTGSCARWIFKDSNVTGQYRIESVGQGTWMSSSDPNISSTKVRLVPNTVIDDTTLWELVEEGVGLSTSLNQSKTLKVYPNPVNDILNIDNIKGSNFSSIKVYDLLGKEVMDKPFNRRLNLSKLKTGFYFLRFSSDTDNNLNQVIKINKL